MKQKLSDININKHAGTLYLILSVEFEGDVFSARKAIEEYNNKYSMNWDIMKYDKSHILIERDTERFATVRADAELFFRYLLVTLNQHDIKVINLYYTYRYND